MAAAAADPAPAVWSSGTAPLLAGSSARAAASPSSRGQPLPAGTMPWGCPVSDNDPARQQPPYPGPEAMWREVADDVHALLHVVTDI